MAPLGRLPRRRRARSPPGPGSTRTGATAASSSSTATGRPRPKRCGPWPADRGPRPGRVVRRTRTPITDLPMLEAVGHPVAVNPDRSLLRIAKSREWEVRRFVRPVRLRARVTVPRPGPRTAAGSGVAVVVAGVVAWWWLRRDARPAAAAPGQESRSLRAAIVPSAIRTTSSRSFFTGAERSPPSPLTRGRTRLRPWAAPRRG